MVKGKAKTDKRGRTRLNVQVATAIHMLVRNRIRNQFKDVWVNYGWVRSKEQLPTGKSWKPTANIASRGVPAGALAAFNAGADILLICQDQKMVLESIKLLRQELLKGEISSHRLHQSIERIMAAKASFLKKPKKVSLKEVRKYFSV